MRLLALIFLLFTTPTLGRADDWLTHDAAHFGAGVAVGTCAHVFFHYTGLVKEHPIASASGIIFSSAAAGFIKELDDQRNGGKFDVEQLIATTFGGIIVTFNFEVMK